MSIEDIAIDLIRVDSEIQPRAHLNEDALTDYQETYEQSAADRNDPPFPPLRVFLDPENTYWLSRGFHRITAAQRAKCDSVRCEVLAGDRRVAVLDAMKDNGIHGVRRTPEDKRKAVCILLDDPVWSKETQDNIATLADVSVGLVRTILGERRSGSKPKKPEAVKSDPPTKKKPGVKGGIKSVEKSDWDEIPLDLHDKLKELKSSAAEIHQLVLNTRDMDQVRDVVAMVDGSNHVNLASALGEFCGPVVFKDKAKQEIPDHLIDVIQDKWFETAEKQIKEIATQLKLRAQKSPWWKGEIGKTIEDLQGIASRIGDCQPSTVCPDCKGEDSECGWCRKCGFMPAWAYNDWKAKNKGRK